MGLTFRLGQVPLAIFTDTSNNVGIGASASASFKFQVTGTTNLTGVLTLGSTISNGTFTYTLPSATGTLALTSALSGYLPLTGGTLTGALSGTSATFSSSVTSNANEGFIIAPSSGASYINYKIGATSYSLIGIAGAANDIITGSATGDLNIRATNSQKILFSNNNGASASLTIASTGAATFSSSVSAGTTTINGNGTVGALIIKALAPNEDIAIDYRTSANVRRGYIGYGALSSSLFELSNNENGDISFRANGGERMRITNSGAVYVTRTNIDLTFADSVGGMYVRQNGSISGLKEELRIFGNSIAFYSHTGSRYASITENGIVSIGTTNTSRQLNVFESIGVRVNQTGTEQEIFFLGRTGSSVNDGIFAIFDNGVKKVNIAANNSRGGDTYFNGGGNVAIGTDTASYKLHVNGTAYATGAAGALSDIRHKNNVLNINEGLNAVMLLRPVSYLWNDDYITDNGMEGLHFGFIAQEVKEILPDVILEQNNEEKTLGLKYTELIPVLVKAVQELKAEIEQLKQK